MSTINEIRKVTTYDYVNEYPINTKHLEAYIQIGDELGYFYVVRYKSGVLNIFNDFPSLPKRARRIVRNSHIFETKYYNNSEIKIWEC